MFECQALVVQKRFCICCWNYYNCKFRSPPHLLIFLTLHCDICCCISFPSVTIEFLWGNDWLVGAAGILLSPLIIFHLAEGESRLARKPCLVLLSAKHTIFFCHQVGTSSLTCFLYFTLGVVKSKRSIWRLSTITDFFWAIMNFIGTFFATMFSVGISYSLQGLTDAYFMPSYLFPWPVMFRWKSRMHTNGAQDLARNGMADQEVVVLEVAHMETDHVDHLVD